MWLLLFHIIVVSGLSTAVCGREMACRGGVHRGMIKRRNPQRDEDEDEATRFTCVPSASCHTTLTPLDAPCDLPTEEATRAQEKRREGEGREHNLLLLKDME